MHLIHRYVGAFFVTAALACGSSMALAGTPQEASVQVRVYDPGHKDYHNWDDHEDRAYRHYLEEKHEEYRKYEKLKHKQQKEYWEWRHSHPD
ncbi:MAG: hypothetical protein ACRD59_15455 [Candidatus Acidiferrales bacterium]